MSYNNIIYSILSNATDVTDIVAAHPVGGAGIYNVVIDQEADLPAILYRKDIVPTDTKGLTTKQDVISVDLLLVGDAAAPDTLDALSLAVRAAMDNYESASVAGYDVSRMQFVRQYQEQYDEQENVIIIQMEFIMKVNRV